MTLTDTRPSCGPMIPQRRSYLPSLSDPIWGKDAEIPDISLGPAHLRASRSGPKSRAPSPILRILLLPKKNKHLT